MHIEKVDFLFNGIKNITKISWNRHGNRRAICTPNLDFPLYKKTIENRIAMKNIRIHLIVLCLLIGEPVAQGLHMIGSISDQSLLSPKQNRTAIFSIKKKKTYHVIQWNIVFILHITRSQFKTNHINNPQGCSQCCQVKQSVYVIFHDNTAIQSNSQK